MADDASDGSTSDAAERGGAVAAIQLDDGASDSDERTPILGRASKPTPRSLWQLFLLTIAFCGVQFGWAIQIAFATPIFLELGVSKFWVSFVWLAGPISGLVVQPTVGVVSDRCTAPWGRRRPFIFWGTVCVIMGMLLISNAAVVGQWLGGAHDATVAIAIIGFWVLDLSNNTIQGPCRALLVDSAPPEQQELGNAFFSFMLGLGNLGGYYIGSLDLVDSLPFFGTNMRALFSIGIVVEITCIAATLLSTHETQYTRPVGSTAENPFIKILRAIRVMPSAMRRVCAVQFFAWVGWFAFMIYSSAWMGEEIFHGDPTAAPGTPARERYDDGVRKGALGLSLFSLITLVCSPALPRIVERVGERPVYFVGQLFLGGCLGASVWIRNEAGALAMIALCGVPWAITMCVPFSIVGRIAGPGASGLYMGVLNIFVVLPQLFVAFGAGFVIEGFGDSLASVLFVGGVSSIIGGGLVWRLIVDVRNIAPPPS